MDQTKIFDKSSLTTLPIDTLITYDQKNGDSSVRLFLVKAGESDNSKGHRGRVHHTDEKSMANPKEHMDPYKKNEAVSQCVLNGGKMYSLLVSGYDRNDPLGGTLTVESDHPLLVRQLTQEGHGMVK